MTVKLRFLVRVSIFKQGFLFFLPLFLSGFQAAAKFQRSINTSGNKTARWEARRNDVMSPEEGDLSASAVFHKGTLVCSERFKLIKIQQGAFLLSCQVLGFFFQRFAPIKPTCVKWHPAQSSDVLRWWESARAMGVVELDPSGTEMSWKQGDLQSQFTLSAKNL